MAQKKRFLDVWLVESNTVYREVPYTVVADWIQQSRLLNDDMVRRSGTKEWFKIGSSPELSAFLPQTKPYEVEDEASALEPVHMGFGWRGPRGEDEDDPDMIPLIDVSLVLLIFFMMTTIGSFSGRETKDLARTYGGQVVDSNDLLWIGIRMDNDAPVFSFGVHKRNTDDQPEGDPTAFSDVRGVKDVDDFAAQLRGRLEQMDKDNVLLIERDRQLVPRIISIEARTKVPTFYTGKILEELSSFRDDGKVDPKFATIEREKP